MPYASRTRRPMRPASKLLVKSRPPNRRAPGRRLSTKYARTRADVNKRLRALTSVTRKLQVRSYGELQYQRYSYVNVGDGSTIWQVCDSQPMCFMHQAINDGAAVWQCRHDTAAVPQTFSTIQIGSWRVQPFEPATINPAYAINDSLQYWANARGSSAPALASNQVPIVQPKFLLKYVDYTMQITGVKNCNDILEVVMVTPRKQFAKTSSNSVTMPLDGLIAHTYTCPLSKDRSIANFQFYKHQVLKRIYMNTQPSVGGTQQYLHTNNRRELTFRVSSNSVCCFADTTKPAQVYDWTELSLLSQSFIMVRSSIERRAVDNLVSANSTAGFNITMQKTACFRDQVGQSTN